MLKKITKNEKGFSLIELMVVLTIVGLLMALMVPNISGFIAQQEINEAAQNVAGIMRSAKEISITKNVNTAVLINANNRTYTLYRQAMPGEVLNGTPMPGDNTYFMIGNTRNISDKNNIGLQTKATINTSGGAMQASNPSVNPVIFTNRGTSNQGTTIYLQPDKEFVQNKMEKMRAITVSAATGRARIYTWNPGATTANKWE